MPESEIHLILVGIEIAIDQMRSLMGEINFQSSPMLDSAFNVS